jgi:DNA repair exonuclease SbcCD nuclease subunit
MRLAHLADVHVRPLSRHDEFKEVFLAFVKDAKESQVDHIFVGGDIFHTKTSGLSPEYIDFMTWLLNELSSFCSVHMILGNHDGNLTNLTRQDAITPIVNALANPRIFLYKKSGVYQFAPGYNWCVFSLFDEEGWQDVQPVHGEINIACYHGPVHGAKSELEWVIEDGLPIEFFEPYDLVFLGDIHRTQYLGYREVEITVDKNDLHRYPQAEVLETVDE